ncbi:unnamed protein product [Musa hybrid cultivar]
MVFPLCPPRLLRHRFLPHFPPLFASHGLVRHRNQEACRMRIEEHHFGSKADAGASKTYRQQAGTIRKNGYIVIKGRPCKVNLLTENGNTRDDLRLPTDETLLAQIKDGLQKGRIWW